MGSFNLFKGRFFFSRFYYEENDIMEWDDGITPFQFTTLTRIRQYYELQKNE
ncbi:hypothetical protein BCV72DRAFT_218429 [Rhizopus microsporus var. microsporus]|uniref:Uncharacterized protein n=1 Tax=Rhizopus microsporus var. microsporus TaxID=86635 RepID=A0A1X0QM43_RHIZD|nr:hypothetical protein BCV72DRAFT_218429 [Rhizopus microsporus var. microsporus]